MVVSVPFDVEQHLIIFLEMSLRLFTLQGAFSKPLAKEHSTVSKRNVLFMCVLSVLVMNWVNCSKTFLCVL